MSSERLLLHDLLLDAAAAHPERPAVVDGDRTLSYEDLAADAGRVACTLVRLGVRRGDRVALWLDKSAESIIGIYGALLAGAVYVPLDPDAPPARVGYIAADCGVEVLLSSSGKEDDWPALVASGAPLRAIVCLDASGGGAAPLDVELIDRRAIDGESPDAPSVAVIDQDLAYILYTSGSTGEPKGVMLSHRNAMAFVTWATREFRVTADDRLSSHAPLHFDLSIFDVFGSAAGAATVVLVPKRTSVFPSEVRRFIERHGITVWYSVPSILSMVAIRGGLMEGSVPSLRAVLFAGEVFPTKYLRALRDVLPHVRFANLYGPTETNVCTWYDVVDLPATSDAPVPIGRAVTNDEVFAVTADGEIAGVGETGELYVRGATVMQGYWGDAERTARGLVPDPAGRPLAGLAYRTGDLVELLPDGSYRYIGRRDGQVKSRGYRIELGDVEAAIVSHAAVVECAAVAVPDEMVTNRIEAHVAVRPGCTVEELIAHCSALVPAYMVPTAFHLHDALPKTSTGKIDRRSLLDGRTST